MSDHITRTFRRILNLVSFARTAAAPVETGSVGTVQVAFNDLATGDARIVMMHFGFYASLPVGTDVVEVRGNGDPSNGVIIASNNQALRPKNLLPGEVQVHDGFGKSIYLTKSGGVVIDANGANVTIDNAPQVLVPNGDVIATGISLLNHIHGGVAAGSADTGKPVP